MAKAPRSASLLNKRLTKAEKSARLRAEEKLRGNNDKLEPSKWLNTSQKQIFRHIVAEMKASAILGNIDLFALEHFVIAIDRLQQIELSINQNGSLLFNKELMSAKDKYSKDLFRGIKELSLTPEGRKKLGIFTKEAKEREEDKLLQILKPKKE